MAVPSTVLIRDDGPRRFAICVDVRGRPSPPGGRGFSPQEAEMCNLGPARPETPLRPPLNQRCSMVWAALAGVVLCVQGCAGAPPAPRDYYFSPRGSDADGLGSADRPYQSIAKANGLRLHPGDRVLFEGGQAF